MFSILKTLSLKAKIIIIYVVILGVGGLLTSFIGSLIVNDTIMNQAKSKIYHDLKTSRMVYDNQLMFIKHEVNARACKHHIQDYLSRNDLETLKIHLRQIRRDIGLDFLSLTDKEGRVLFRATNPDSLGDDLSYLSVIDAALNGLVIASTESFPRELLMRESEQLARQANIQLIDTPKARPTDKTAETSGLVMIAASPIINQEDDILGVLYGGHLLNKNYSIVDKVWELVFRGEKYKDEDIGTVTIFLDDLRISTNVKTKDNNRAIGTRVSAEVYNAVLLNGNEWSDRAFVVNDWYISEYEPIRNYENDIIGILYVGVLEKAYLAIRNRVILTFLGVASLGFIFIILISYLITRTITRPLGEMVKITQSITSGDLNHEVKVDSSDEIGQLGSSFNTMVKSLRKMRGELENWGKTLEQKVKKRTEELRAMQNKVIQTERLASLGKMAAGIAHEINNPLGGILVLSSLCLEDLKDDDPNRSNLEEIVKQTIRCRDIVKGLLQFSRQTEPKMSVVKIDDILKNTLSLIEKQAIFHNIEIEKKFSEDLPYVTADESQMQQVFMNVILNASQAMKEIGTLTLETAYNKDDNMVVITFTDSGDGIKPEIIDKIFDPFFTTKDVGEGTGLGLSIAYGIVTKHSGKMSVDSKVGESTTFTIQLPASTSN
ncbi:MAG: cache domain-containing protein [candidate division KSB1 bacterium]|nr:cache domain-containing protein [candidate division KSB1 bacterium]